MQTHKFILYFLLAVLLSTSAFSVTYSTEAYYSLDNADNSGGLPLDLTANNHDATTNDAITGATGSLNEAYDFESTNSDYFEVPDDAGLDLTSSYTLRAWIKPESLGANQGIICKDGNQAGESRPYCLFIGSDDSLRFIINGGGTIGTNEIRSSSSAFSTGTTYHVVGVHRGTELEIYIDGVSVGTASTSVPSSTSGTETLQVGARSYSTSRIFFDGIIDEVGIFDTAWSDTDVTDDYNSGTPVNPFVAEPVITVVSPLNLTHFNSNTNTEQDFVFNPEGNGTTIDDCTIYTNRTGSWSNSNMQTDNSPTADAENTINPAIALTTGTYKWAVRCQYGISSGHYIFSQNYTVYVDYTDPVITLNAPADNYYEATTPALLNYSVSDNFGGTVDCNITQNSIVVDTATVTSGESRGYAPVTGEATNSWNVTCQDDAGNSLTSATREHTRDNTAPTTTLFAPANGSTYFTTTINFTAVADDNLNEEAGTFPGSYCNLYINGSLNVSGFSNNNIWNTTGAPLTSPNVVFSNQVFPVGSYSYNFQCKDEADNIANSSTYFFTVAEPIATLNISFFNSTDNSTVTDSVQVILNNGTADVFTNSTTAGFLYYYNLTPANYTATISSADYDTQNQNVEVGFNTQQDLNVYLVTSTTPTNDTTFTFRNLYTNVALDDVTLAVEKNISGTWTLVDSETSDINGRITYTYEVGEGYRFTASKTNYESKIFSLVPISYSSYLIKLEPNTSGGGDDYGRVSVVYVPTSFTENSTVVFNISFASPTGSLEFYSYNVTYQNYSIEGNGTNAYGGSLSDSIDFPFASGSDRVRVYYSYQLTGSPFREYVIFYELQDFTPEAGTIDASNIDSSGLTLFEKAVLSTIILAIGVGLAWLYSGILGAGLVAELLLGFLAYQGFLTWLIAVPSMILLFLLIMRGVGR